MADYRFLKQTRHQKPQTSSLDAFLGGGAGYRYSGSLALVYSMRSRVLRVTDWLLTHARVTGKNQLNGERECPYRDRVLKEEAGYRKVKGGNDEMYREDNDTDPRRTGTEDGEPR